MTNKRCKLKIIIKKTKKKQKKTDKQTKQKGANQKSAGPKNSYQEWSLS